MTKEKRNIHRKQYRQNNRYLINERDRIYRRKNKDKINARRRLSGYDSQRHQRIIKKDPNFYKKRYLEWKEKNKEMLLEKANKRLILIQNINQEKERIKNETTQLKNKQKELKKQQKIEEQKQKTLARLERHRISKETKKERARQYRLTYKNKLTPEQIEQQKEKKRIYHKNRTPEQIEYRKQYRKQWQKQQYTNNPHHRLKQILRERVRKALKGKGKNGSAVKDLGCSIEELKIYLESKFLLNMSWDNYGTYGWHVDHIIPLSQFNLSDRNEFLKACHYTNLQPLWAIDNIKKSNKLIYTKIP